MKLFVGTMMVVAMTAIGCSKAPKEGGVASLKVSPAELKFDQSGLPADDYNGTITVEANRPWRVTVPKDAEWVRVSQTEGKGNGTITVSMPATSTGRSTKIAIGIYNAAVQAPIEERMVTITQGSVVPSEEIYRETFGTAAVSGTAPSKWPFIEEYTDWNTTGSGASTVSYEGFSTTIRNSGRNNTGGYEQASGPNHVFFGAVGNYFTVKNITLPASGTNYRLTFGGQFYDNVNNDFKVDDMSVSLSADGANWVPLTYTISGDPNTAPNWIFATADFTLAAPATSLYIKYSASVASVYRVDDIALATGNGGQSIDLGGTIDPNAPAITAVSPTSVSLPSGGGTQPITVTIQNQGSNTLSASGLSGMLSASVSGTTVTVTGQPNSGAAVNQTLTISLSNGNSKTVPVTLAGNTGGGNEIYRETAGTQAVASPWPLVTAYTGWGKTGTGASTVTYDAEGTVSVRSSGTASGGYNGASGANNIFFGTGTPVFIVKNITMPSSTNFNLSFGGQYFVFDTKDNNFDTSKFLISLSADGTTWVPLTYTKNSGDQATPYWILGSADFTLTAATSALYIRFAASVPSVFRMDDIVLTEGAGGQSIDLGGSVTPGTPTITAVNPTSLNFTNAGGTQPITVTVQNQGSNTLSASGLSGMLSASVSGTTVTVTAQPNTGAAVNQTLTISLSNGNSKTVPVTLAGGSDIGGEFFNETFGDGTLTATGAGGAAKIAAYTGWSMTAPIAYSDSYATADIRKTATMNEALWLPQQPDTELVISGLPTGKTGVVMTFDMAAQNVNTNANQVQIFAGSTELTSQINNAFTSTNTYAPITVNIPDNTTSIRFFSPAGTPAFRIDNVVLTSN